MKQTLRKVFSPILNIFESGEEQFTYQASHRTILIVLGLLFMVLSTGAYYATKNAADIGGLFPVIVFFSIGVVCEIVGLLGTDQAVAKIWRNK